MKKLFKIGACLIMCLSFGGCFNKMYTRSATNDIKCANCTSVNDISSLLKNVESSMKSVSAVKIDYELTNTKTTFNIQIDAITKNKRVDWDLFSIIEYDDKTINVYLKDSKLYFLYPHNGANLVLKDKLENFVYETERSFDKLNATYDKENLKEIMLGNKLEGIDFEQLKDNSTYIKNSDGSYLIIYQSRDTNIEIDVTSNYLFKEVRTIASNYNSTLKFSYPEELTIEYPMGLDFLTLDIEEAKEVLKIDTFAEIIDKDVK